MRANLFNKKAEPRVERYGTPTPTNPILPSPSPEQIEEESEQRQPEPVMSASDVSAIPPPPSRKMPGQPGNPPSNPAGNGPQIETRIPESKAKTIVPPQPRPPGTVPKAFGRLAQVDVKKADRTILPEPAQPQGKTPYEYDPLMSQRTTPIAEPPYIPAGVRPPATGAPKKGFKTLHPDLQNALRTMGHCKTCHQYLGLATYPRLVEHLRADHGYDEKFSHKVAHEAFKRIVEYRRRQSPVTASRPKLFSQRVADEVEDMENLSEGSSTARAIADERGARRRANNELANLGRRYHSTLPIQDIKGILQKHGFNPEVMDGIYTGEDGKIHEQCGPHTWIAMTWHKLPRTGLWEIVAYLS